jgi:hypothetical protein
MTTSSDSRDASEITRNIGGALFALESGASRLAADGLYVVGR